MASERKTAKTSVLEKSEDDPEFEDAQKDARSMHLEIKKEDNRHKEKLSEQNLGLIGRIVGDGKSTPTLVAFSSVLLSIVIACGCYIAAYKSNDVSFAEYWAKQAERVFSFGTMALGYIFGKNTK